jgi:opacity protein-like surface antigen
MTSQVNIPALAKSVSSSDNDKSSGFSQTLKLGYYFNQNNRVMAFYQNCNADDAKVSMYGAGYDYLIGESAFQPFIGVFVGQSSLDDSKNNFDATATNYGAQVGLSYTFSQNISLEVGYRFIKSDMQQSNSYSDTAYGYATTLKETAKVDTFTNMFVGINYKF